MAYHHGLKSELRDLRLAGEMIAPDLIDYEEGSAPLDVRKWFEVKILTHTLLKYGLGRYVSYWASEFDAGRWVLVNHASERTMLIDEHEALRGHTLQVNYAGGHHFVYHEDNLVHAQGGNPIYADEATAARLDEIILCDGTLPADNYIVERLEAADAASLEQEPPRRVDASERLLQRMIEKGQRQQRNQREASGYDWLRERGRLIMRLKKELVITDARRVARRLEALYRAGHLETDMKDWDMYLAALENWSATNGKDAAE